MRKITQTLVLLFLIVCSGMLHAQSIVFVNANASGNNDGTSWPHAYTNLQDGINRAAIHGGEVWVAQGVYYPTHDTLGNRVTQSRNASFVLRNNVEIIGGFIGNESNKQMRNYHRYPVTLSGNIKQNQTAEDNVHHVIYSRIGTDSTAILDGVTIREGYSDTHGGGGFLQGGTIRNCSCIQNTAKQFGGGLFARNTTIESSIFRNNSAQKSGGGAYVQASQIQETQIFSNTALEHGGGVYAHNSTLSIVEMYANRSELQGGAVFLHNSRITYSRVLNNAAEDGGGVYAQGQSHIISTLLSNNKATATGGAAYGKEGAVFINITVTNNSAETGGGLYFETTGGLYNSVFWNNTGDLHKGLALIEHTLFSDDSYGAPRPSHIFLYDSTKPLFTKLPDTTAFATTPMGIQNIRNAHWEPAYYSQLLERGKNSLITSYPIDAAGKNRINNAPLSPHSSNSTAIVDLGAFEAKSRVRLSFNNRVYVSTQWRGKGDGTSWENATSDIQRVLDYMARYYPSVNPHIWVQTGIYLPENEDAQYGFQIRSKLELYGGFAGNEIHVNQRNLDVYVTQLSGDFGVFGDNTDNIRTVMYVASSSILDGFYIFGARETGLIALQNSIIRNCEIAYNGINTQSAGVRLFDSKLLYSKIHNNNSLQSSYAGVYASNSEIRSCFIFNNTARNFGAGCYLNNSLLLDSYVYENTVTSTTFSSGGGVYAMNQSLIKNTVIRNNVSAQNGGGVFLQNSGIEHSKIHNNISDLVGGGVYGNTTSYISHSYIYNNSAYQGGAVFSIGNIINSVIHNNSAEVCGGVYNFSNISYSTITNNASTDNAAGLVTSSGTIVSSIVWGNKSKNWNYPVYFSGTGSIEYSAIQGGWSGNGNFFISEENDNAYGPHFIMPTTQVGVSNEDSDWNISAASIVIDKSVFDSNIPSTDIVGKCRVVGTAPDVGAYEFGISEYDTLTPYRFYVNIEKNGNGMSWDEALPDLHKAMFLADFLGVSEIWVAQGTYLTSEYRDRDKHYTLRPNIALYGGFKGDEQFLEQRQIGRYPSILSGDVGRLQREYDDAYTIIRFFPLSARDSAILDGFTIQNAYNDNEPTKPFVAADLRQTIVRNCVFTKNKGISLRLENGRVEHSVFYNNDAEQVGGTVQLISSSIQHSVIHHNRAKSGGGIFADRSDISEVKIFSNTAKEDGGGIYAIQSKLSGVEIYNNRADNNGGGVYLKDVQSSMLNSVIFNNTSLQNGGGIYADDCKEIIAVTVCRNTSGASGGGLYARGQESSQLINALFWGNIAEVDSSMSLQANVFRNGFTGNASSDTIRAVYAYHVRLDTQNYSYTQEGVYPHFKNPSRFVGYRSDSISKAELAYVNWQLGRYSAVIDAGVVLPTIPYDIIGKQRTIKGICEAAEARPDIGAYERKSCNVTPTNSVFYVADTWRGTGDGSSWEHARDNLQEVIDSAHAHYDDVQEVWVAQGVYMPEKTITENSTDTVDQRLKTFILRNNVQVYGGFTGVETDLRQRNPFDNKTVLSGFYSELGQQKRRFQVLSSLHGTDSTAVLNGFFITGGYADDFFDRNLQRGGGAFMQGGILMKCFIIGNTAYYEGGGVYLAGSSRLINSVVANNYSFTHAAGVAAVDNASIEISTIVRNTANRNFGGVFLNNNGYIENSVVWGNTGRNHEQINTLNAISYCAIQSDTLFSINNSIPLSESNTEEIELRYPPLFVEVSPVTNYEMSLALCSELAQTNWAIRRESVLIDKAHPEFYPYDSVDTDIRQLTRISNQIADIGAFEYNGAPIITSDIPDVQLCVQQSTHISISAVGEHMQYQWEFLDGIRWSPILEGLIFTGTKSSTLQIQARYHFNDAIQIRCRVFNADGSAVSNTGFVSMYALPNIYIAKEYSLCKGEVIEVYIQDQESIAWGNGLSGTTVQLLETGYYSYTITNQHGCSVQDSLHVTIGIEPRSPFALDTMYLCSGEQVWLRPDFNYAAYRWNDNSTNSNLVIHNDGLYSVAVTDYNGCKISDTIYVIVTKPLQPTIQFVSYTPNGRQVNILTTPQHQAYHSAVAYASLPQQFSFVEVDTIDAPHLLFATPLTAQPSSYSIRMRDTCGTFSQFSEIHTPLILKAYERVSNTEIIDLFWSHYVGLPRSEYSVYRGKTRDNMEFVAHVSADRNYYSLRAEGYSYFRVSMNLPQEYIYNSTSFTITYSNQATIQSWLTVNVPEDSIDHAPLLVYPVPSTTGIIQYTMPEQEQLGTIVVTDMNGRLVHVEQITAPQGSIFLEHLQNGIYTVFYTNPTHEMKYVQKISIMK